MHGDADCGRMRGGRGRHWSGWTRRPTGRVVGIIRRNWRTRGYCGSLKPGQRGGARSAAVLFVPVERQLPMIRIHTRQVSIRAPLLDARSGVHDHHSSMRCGARRRTAQERHNLA